MRSFLLGFVVLVGALGGCTDSGSPSRIIVVGAAISLQPALDEAAAAFMAMDRRDSVVLSYAGSGTIRHQVEFGAPIDVFLSAAEDHIDSLDARGYVRADSRTVVATNTLMLIMPVRRPPISGLADLALSGIKRIAIGQPDIVPAGMYARDALQRAGLLEEVRDKFVYANDVQQVLVYVQTGSVDAGFVYTSDVGGTPPVRVIGAIPDSLYAPVRYLGVVVQASRHPDIAGRFLVFLTSDEGQHIFRRHSFGEAP